MTKQLKKRHMRQVARAKQKGKQSEPDVRSEEEVRAARAASAPLGGWGGAKGPGVFTAPRRQRAVQGGDSRSPGDS